MREDLHEQIRYYRARAAEFDEIVIREGWPSAHTLPTVTAALYSLRPKEQILELACGTGLWTKELLNIGQAITALDASPEMLDINRQKLSDPRVTYDLVDLFAWTPSRRYDLVFAGFWLSHVPPELLDDFLGKVARAVRRGGHVFAVDQYAEWKEKPASKRAGIHEERKTFDGQAYTVVKVYYDPDDLAHKLDDLGFDACSQRIDDSVFMLTGIKRQQRP